MTDEFRSDPVRLTHVDGATVGVRADFLALGLSVAFSCLSIASGVAALSTGSAAYQLGATLGAAASTAIALGVLGLVFVFVALRFDRRLEAGLYRLTAGLVTFAGAMAAIGFASSVGEEPDLYRLFDNGGAVVFVVAGCLLGVAGTGAACVVLTQQSARRPRTGFAAGALAAVVAVALVVPLAAGYADKPWRSVEVAAAATPSVPTEIGRPAFRVVFDNTDRRPYVVAAGPGFIARSGRAVTAYDGLTGDERWSFAFGDFTVGAESDARPGLDVIKQEEGDVVQMTNVDVSVDLDANTGRMMAVRRGERVERERIEGEAELLDGGLARTGDDGRVRVTAADGGEIDSFALPPDFGVGRQVLDGYLILRPRASQVFQGRIMLRDFAAHTNRTIAFEKLADDDIAVENIVAIGDRMLVTSFHEAFLVDPSRGTIDEVDVSRWCASSAGAIFEVTTAPGAVLVTCGYSGLGAQLSEVVGLR